MKRYFPTHAPLFALSLGLLLCAPEVAFADQTAPSGKGLTTYEQNLVCKLSGTCDSATGNAAKPADGSNGASRDVGQEAAFSVYQGNSKSVASTPVTGSGAPVTRAGFSTSPNSKAKYAGGLGQSGHRIHSAGSAGDVVADTGRANAADVRVLFANGSADLDAHGMAEIGHFAHALEAPELADKHFVVEGHTNSVGARAYNLDLSQRRAQAVVDYLVKLGVETTRLQAKGYGFDHPRMTDPKAAGNRRVEVVKAD